MYYKVGSETKATYLDKTFTVVESDLTRPEVDVSVTLNNGSLPSKFGGIYIQGKSKIDIWLSSITKYGASIKSFSLKADGKNYGFEVKTQESKKIYFSNTITTEVIQSSGKVDIVGYAKDSREITGSLTKSIVVMEYAKPTVRTLDKENAVLCYRSDGNGKRVGNSTSVWVKAERSYYSLGGNNTCALQYRVKPANDAWNDSTHKWVDLIPGSSIVNSYNALIPGAVFDLKTSYNVQIRAIDDIGEFDTKTFEIPTQDVALHLGKGGKNVAIGTYCDYSEEYTFYSEWKAIFNKGIFIGPNKTPLEDYILSVINGGG
jgi:hypothetical protein